MGITNRALSFAIVATIFSLLVFGCAGTVVTSKSLGQAQDTSIGPVLVAPDGRTLYTYDKDDKGVSNCSGLCAAAWPPLLAPDSAHATDSFTVITRSSGDKQWAYKGQPLYLYIEDSIPSDVDGDGADGVWHVARPPKPELSPLSERIKIHETLRLLIELGYDAAVDDTMKINIAGAIRDFQRDHNLPVNGKVTDGLLATLRNAKQ